MRSLLALCVLLPSLSFAQVFVSVGVPTIRFEVAPPLVVVQPGVQVVEDYDEDLYVVNGYYWARRGDAWYRSRDWRGNWVVVERRVVPRTLWTIEPGRYRHYRSARYVRERRYEHERRYERDDDHDRGHGNGHGGGHGHGHHGHH